MIFNTLPLMRLLARLHARRAAAAADSSIEADAMTSHPELRLSDIRLREVVELVSIDLPADELEPLLELGVMPGCTLCPVRNSPFGDPVLMVDGSLIAVRREMARCLCVRRGGLAAN